MYNVNNNLKKVFISLLALPFILIFYLQTERIWQDYVFLFGGFTLTLTLFPTILSKKSSVSRITSITSSIILLIFSFTFLYISLYLSFFGTLLSSIAWGYIAIFRPLEKQNYREKVSFRRVLLLLSAIFISILVIVLTSYSFEDYVFMFGAFILSLSLVPTIVNKESYVPRWTSFPAFITLLTYTVTFITLELYLSSLSHFFNAVAWLYVLLFRGEE